MKTALSRRTFLKAAGVKMALPFLEAMEPAKDNLPLRFIGLQMPFGFLPQNLYPETKAELFNTPYMKHLAAAKDSVTLFNGLQHPGINSGHDSNYYFLTGGTKRTKVNSISVDQIMAEKLYGKTRFSSLVTGIELRAGASYTRAGIKIPVQDSPKALFEALFMGGKAGDIEKKRVELANGRSILDALSYYRKKMDSKVSTKDRERLEQYFTSVRTVERELQMSEQWLGKPYPKVEPMKFPVARLNEIDVYRYFMQVFKLVLETDSSRLMTFDFGQTRGVINLEGISTGYHGLSHHRGEENNLTQLTIIENEMFKIFGDFLSSLKAVNEQHGTLLDNTMIVFGSGLENPNNHSAARPPVIFAGGGQRHRGYMHFEKDREVPVSNLYLNLLHRMDIAAASFGSSNGTLEI